MLSKSDLVPAEHAEEAAAEFRERLGNSVEGVVATSSATGAGLGELRGAIAADVLDAPPDQGAFDDGAPEFEAEHRVYRPAGEGGYTVVEEEEGAFRVEGRGVEMLFARHDLSNHEALAYVEQRLNEIGVIAALRSAGFEPGDEVRVGEDAFELHP